MANGIVSADEIRRRIQLAGGDITNNDLTEGGGWGRSIRFVPTHRAGHSLTQEELVDDYVRYLTELHERREDLLSIPEYDRPQHILAEARRAAARHFNKEKP